MAAAVNPAPNTLPLVASEFTPTVQLDASFASPGLAGLHTGVGRERGGRDRWMTAAKGKGTPRRQLG